MQVLWSMAGLLPSCLLWDLPCTPGDLVSSPPPRLLSGCLFGLYMFVCVDCVQSVFVVLATAVAQGRDVVFPRPAGCLP